MTQTSGFGLVVLEGKTPNTVPAVRVPLAIRAMVKSQEYVECRGPRGNSRLTTIAGNPRLPKKKKIIIKNERLITKKVALSLEFDTV